MAHTVMTVEKVIVMAVEKVAWHVSDRTSAL